TWEIRNTKAHGIITQYISDQLLLDLKFETTTKGLFDHIDGESPIAQHISTISSANTRLTSMKKGFNNEMLAFLLLYSLPKNSTWEIFTASVLRSLPDSEVLSFHTVSN
ncbi:hypothetical protein M422DRAFT_157312, partial [Sphaerobolus stellatus SS14]